MLTWQAERLKNPLAGTKRKCCETLATNNLSQVAVTYVFSIFTLVNLSGRESLSHYKARSLLSFFVSERDFGCNAQRKQKGL